MLPQLVPLSEAAQRLGVDAEQLRAWAESGMLIAGMFDGKMLVAIQEAQPPMKTPSDHDNGSKQPTTAVDDLNARLAAIKRDDYAHLDGELITLTEASQEFRIPRGTLRDWLYRGYIRGVGKYPVRVNKADVAYCAKIYHVRKQFNSRAPLLDGNGNPYLLKEPELARLRRLAKK